MSGRETQKCGWSRDTVVMRTVTWKNRGKRAGGRGEQLRRKGTGNRDMRTCRLQTVSEPGRHRGLGQRRVDGDGGACL